MLPERAWPPLQRQQTPSNRGDEALNAVGQGIRWNLARRMACLAGVVRLRRQPHHPMRGKIRARGWPSTGSGYGQHVYRPAALSEVACPLCRGCRPLHRVPRRSESGLARPYGPLQPGRRPSKREDVPVSGLGGDRDPTASTYPRRGPITSRLGGLVEDMCAHLPTDFGRDPAHGQGDMDQVGKRSLEGTARLCIHCAATAYLYRGGSL